METVINIPRSARDAKPEKGSKITDAQAQLDAVHEIIANFVTCLPALNRCMEWFFEVLKPCSENDVLPQSVNDLIGLQIAINLELMMLRTVLLPMLEQKQVRSHVCFSYEWQIQ